MGVRLLSAETHAEVRCDGCTMWRRTYTTDHGWCRESHRETREAQGCSEWVPRTAEYRRFSSQCRRPDGSWRE